MYAYRPCAVAPYLTSPLLILELRMSAHHDTLVTVPLGNVTLGDHLGPGDKVCRVAVVAIRSPIPQPVYRDLAGAAQAGDQVGQANLEGLGSFELPACTKLTGNCLALDRTRRVEVRVESGGGTAIEPANRTLRSEATKPRNTRAKGGSRSLPSRMNATVEIRDLFESLSLKIVIQGRMVVLNYWSHDRSNERTATARSREVVDGLRYRL